jgi:hypothetical protein
MGFRSFLMNVLVTPRAKQLPCQMGSGLESTQRGAAPGPALAEGDHAGGFRPPAARCARDRCEFGAGGQPKVRMVRLVNEYLCQAEEPR